MPDDVVLNKVASLERGIERIRQVYAQNDQNLYENLMAQDSTSNEPVKCRLIWLCTLSESGDGVFPRRVGMPLSYYVPTGT